jgi:hypothetical protein
MRIKQPVRKRALLPVLRARGGEAFVVIIPPFMTAEREEWDFNAEYAKDAEGKRKV